MSVPIRVAALLDASVMVPAALRDTLLRAAAAGLYSLWFSETILDEVQRTLVNNGFASAASAERLMGNLRSYFWFAFAEGYESIVSEMTNDPGDHHVLAAAVKANATIVVTANLRHFPQAALGPHGITGMSPDDFLTMLLQQDAGAFVSIVTQQAADLTSPPLSTRDVLDRLHIHAPTFVERISIMLDADEPP